MQASAPDGGTAAAAAGTDGGGKGKGGGGGKGHGGTGGGGGGKDGEDEVAAAAAVRLLCQLLGPEGNSSGNDTNQPQVLHTSAGTCADRTCLMPGAAPHPAVALSALQVKPLRPCTPVRRNRVHGRRETVVHCSCLEQLDSRRCHCCLAQCFVNMAAAHTAAARNGDAAAGTELTKLVTAEGGALRRFLLGRLRLRGVAADGEVHGTSCALLDTCVLEPGGHTAFRSGSNSNWTHADPPGFGTSAWSARRPRRRR